VFVIEELLMTDEPLTVGQVADALGVTVRTLHHYDEIGLVTPSLRSKAGYRLYTEDDLRMLQHVVVYRRLGFPLDEIGELLADGADVAEHLRRQRTTVTDRVAELTALVTAIDRALESEMNGYRITRQEQRELFGDAFDDDYAAEAQERWGDSEAWEQSQRRAKSYTKEQWQQIKQETDEINGRYAELMRAGVPSNSPEAMDVAEDARRQIGRWFYDCSREMHAGIANMYVSDPRYTQAYEALAPGLAQYVRGAVVANTARD
jgi:MerR family transcriptional regulator, thiopeptide resistance regulator